MGGFDIGDKLGRGCEVGRAGGTIPCSNLNGGNGRFFGIDGLNNLDGESGGGGIRMLFINLRKAVFDVGTMGGVI